jgi:uncharacterized membrane protein YciS (DUF1049 family)
MPPLRKEEENRVTGFQYLLSIGLFVATLLMWLFWDTATITVLITGVAALTVIIKSYRQKEETDSKSRFGSR